MDVLKSFHESLLAAKASGDGEGYSINLENLHLQHPRNVSRIWNFVDLKHFEAISEYVLPCWIMLDLSILL